MDRSEILMATGAGAVIIGAVLTLIEPLIGGGIIIGGMLTMIYGLIRA